MSDELVKLEKSVEHVEVSPTFASPVGDASLKFLDQEFTRIEKWISEKLGDSLYKELVLSQLKFVYLIIRSSVEKALS